MKKVFCIYFILFSSYYSISYAQYTLAPDGSYVGSDSYSLAPDGSYVGGDSYSLTPDGSYQGYDKSDSESTNDTFGQDWNNFGQ
jgi:hypothetical protein